MAEKEDVDVLGTPSSGVYDVDIPNFETEETKVLFPPGMYRMVLGRVVPKVEDGVLKYVAQEIWVIKYLGIDKFDNTDADWRCKMNEGKVWMASHRGVKILEFFPNPVVQPNMKWKPFAFYKNFPGSIVSKPNPVDVAKPTQEVSWKAVSFHFGQVFEVEQAFITYKNREKEKVRKLQMTLDTILPTKDKLPIADMLMIEQKYEELKASESGGTAHAAPQIKTDIEEDMPF